MLGKKVYEVTADKAIIENLKERERPPSHEDAPPRDLLTYVSKLLEAGYEIRLIFYKQVDFPCLVTVDITAFNTLTFEVSKELYGEATLGELMGVFDLSYNLHGGTLNSAKIEKSEVKIYNLLPMTTKSPTPA